MKGGKDWRKWREGRNGLKNEIKRWLGRCGENVLGVV